MYRIGVVGNDVLKSEINTLSSNENFTMHNFPETESLASFIAENDFIFITNCQNAFELADLSIRNGKHIFIENVANFSLDELELLIKICKEGSIKSTIHFKENKNLAIDSIKGNIISPLFIETNRLTTIKNTRYENDVVFEQMLHDIFIVLDIVKSELKRISATGVKVISEFKDIANARLEFSNGCIANFTSSRISLKEMSKMRIFQKDSYYSVDFIEQKTDLISMQSQQNSEQKLNVISKTFAKENTLAIEIEQFIKCIEENTHPKVSLEAGYRTLSVANKIIKKINSFGEE